MPGLQYGTLELALLCLRLRHDLPASTEANVDWGPYEPWALPHVLLAQNRPREAAIALRRAPHPPPDLLLEALWGLTAKAAIAVGDTQVVERSYTALAPAAAELAGAASGPDGLELRDRDNPR